jgi:CRP-like cAMP-binding protein
MAEIISIFEPYLVHRSYPAGKTLWLQGDTDNALIILEHGRVKIIRTKQDGTTVLLYVFGPGEIFGLSQLFLEGGCPVTAEAIDDVEVKILPKTIFHQIIKDNPEVVHGLFAILGKRLRQAFDRIENMSSHDVTGRIAAYIETLIIGKLTTFEQPVVLIPRPLYISAQEINVTPETFSRILTKLEKSGIIKRIERGRIQVLNNEALLRIASGEGTIFTL